MTETEQLIAALAAAFLPFAGKTGVQVATAIPALQTLLTSFQNSGKTIYTVDELVAIVQTGSSELVKLKADIDAMP